ncbi:MAG: hypothetical protein JJU00_13075 [Opitutales bacterium]|nr:hypothetical protein [Opitutales bacterium]
MSDRIQVKRGSTAARMNTALAPGEEFWDTDLREMYCGDLQETAGGVRTTLSPARPVGTGGSAGANLLGRSDNNYPIMPGRNIQAAALSGSDCLPFANGMAVIAGRPGHIQRCVCNIYSSASSFSGAGIQLNTLGLLNFGSALLLPHDDAVFNFRLDGVIYSIDPSSAGSPDFGEITAAFTRQCLVKRLDGTLTIESFETVGTDANMGDFTVGIEAPPGGDATPGAFAVDIAVPSPATRWRAAATIDGIYARMINA